MYRHPKGYKHNPRCPELRGDNHCPSCLCTPCVIVLPPDFLKGSCDPHPANDEKRFQLYRKFWRLLNSLDVWRDEEYLQRKTRRTVRDDKREIMPACVIEVCISIHIYFQVYMFCHITCHYCFAFRPSDLGTQVIMEHTGTICLHLMLKTTDHILHPHVHMLYSLP